MFARRGAEPWRSSAMRVHPMPAIFRRISRRPVPRPGPRPASHREPRSAMSPPRPGRLPSPHPALPCWRPKAGRAARSAGGCRIAPLIRRACTLPISICHGKAAPVSSIATARSRDPLPLISAATAYARAATEAGPRTSSAASPRATARDRAPLVTAVLRRRYRSLVPNRNLNHSAALVAPFPALHGAPLCRPRGRLAADTAGPRPQHPPGASTIRDSRTAPAFSTRCANRAGGG